MEKSASIFFPLLMRALGMYYNTLLITTCMCLAWHMEGNALNQSVDDVLTGDNDQIELYPFIAQVLKTRIFLQS